MCSKSRATPLAQRGADAHVRTGSRSQGWGRFPARPQMVLRPTGSNSGCRPSPRSRSSPPTGCTTKGRRRSATSRSPSAPHRGVCGAAGRSAWTWRWPRSVLTPRWRGRWNCDFLPGGPPTPAQRMFRLAPGAHLLFSVDITPAADAAPGRYFVAAQHRRRGRADPRGHRHRGIPARRVGLASRDRRPEGRCGHRQGRDRARRNRPFPSCGVTWRSSCVAAISNSTRASAVRSWSNCATSPATRSGESSR